MTDCKQTLEKITYQLGELEWGLQEMELRTTSTILNYRDYAGLHCFGEVRAYKLLEFNEYFYNVDSNAI